MQSAQPPVEEEMFNPVPTRCSMHYCISAGHKAAATPEETHCNSPLKKAKGQW